MKKAKGFSLIELMIVIAILGLLAAILLPHFVRAKVSAQHAACVSNVKNIATGLESYRIENKFYPTKAEYDADFYGADSKYISSLPFCPALGKSDGQYFYEPNIEGDNYNLHCREGLKAHTALHPLDDGYPKYTAGGLILHKANDI